jgi:hypothetical protein
MGSKDLVGVSWPFQTLVVSILCVCESFASKEMLVCTVSQHRSPARAGVHQSFEIRISGWYSLYITKN